MAVVRIASRLYGLERAIPKRQISTSRLLHFENAKGSCFTDFLGQTIFLFEPRVIRVSFFFEGSP